MENKHYIRVLDGNIIKGFSDAFDIPNENDICINTNGGRHFEISGELNPSLYVDGVCLYKYTNNKIVKKTDDEVNTERQK